MASAPLSLHGKPMLRALALACALLPAGCFIEPEDPGAFYRVDEAALSGQPGDILRIEDFPGAPEGTNAWRVLYRSTGLDGAPSAVSGVILAPQGAPAAGPRPVVAWAHPTTGVADRCAPSLSKSFYARTEGLKTFLDRGYVVAATDYPGLGTESPHPYLVGVSEGRAVLDSVRAAMRLEEAHASNSFVVWGHSQGGHAALYTGQLAASYAPDLKLAGVAAAAPATDLATLLRDDISSGPGKVLTAFALWSWHRVYDAPLADLLDAPAQAAVDEIAADCLEGPLQAMVMARREKPIDKDFLATDITEIEPWKSLLHRNSPDAGNAGAALYIAQGSADPIVRPAVTRGYAEAACRAGTPVRLDWREGVDHLKIGTEAVPAVADWMAGRFAGAPPVSDCGKLPGASG